MTTSPAGVGSPVLGTVGDVVSNCFDLEDHLDATIRFDHSLLAVESEHTVHAMLELVAPAAPTDDRQPLHLALVIDRSGSMGAGKLEAAKSAARFLCEHMRDTDELALVAYDDSVDLVSPLQ